MNVSGAQKPGVPLLVQLASSDWSAIGTSEAGTQCAPLHVGLHAGNCVGSMSGGPVYGHAGPPPPSPDVRLPPSPQMTLSMLHAPVAMFVSGSMHGTHSSPRPHVSCLRRLTCELLETSVMHWLRHTPWRSR